MENLNYLANEINRDWSKDYIATVENNTLILKHDNNVIATIDDSNNVNVLVEGFEESIEQLHYMIER